MQHNGGVFSTMKRVIFVLIILFTFSSLFAVDPSFDQKTTPQTLTGYYDTGIYLSVSEYFYENWDNGYGINLDYTDDSNTINTALIAPTSTMLMEPGLQIGTFDLFILFLSYTSAKLTITHDKLVNTTGDEVDWELGVKYTLNNGTSLIDAASRMCLSSDSTLTSNSAQKSIVLNFSSTNTLASIQNGGLYFRLTSGSPVTENGFYESTIQFTLEAL